MDLTGLPDDTFDSPGLDLGGLPDTNASVLRKQYRATQTAPDEAAQVLDLSKRTGLPPPVVQRNKQVAQKRAMEPDWADLETSAPLTVRELAGNAKLFDLAHDDTENLRGIERTVGGTARDIAVTGLKGAVGLPQAFVGLADIPTFGLVGKGLDTLGVRFNDAQRELGLMYSPAQQQANREVQQADGFFDTLGAAVSNPSVIATTVGESLPQMLGGMAVARGLLRVAPSLSPLFAGAAGEGVVGAGSAAEQTRAGTTDNELTAKQSAAAVASGVGTAVFSLMGGKLAQRLGIEDIDTALARGGVDLNTAETVRKGFVRRMAEGGISEGLFEELPQSAQEQIWQNFAADKPLLEGVGNAAALGLLAGAVTGGGFSALVGPSAELDAQQAQAQAATQDAQALQQLAQLAAASKLRQRDPQTFQDFVAAANEDGAVQDLYLDARTLQQSGVDLAALAQAAPAVAQQLNEALATGGDVVIPVSEYAAKIAGTEFDSALLPYLRTSEDAISISEIPAAEEQARLFQETAAKVMEEKAADDAWQQSAKAVEAEMFKQLQSAGRFTDDVNTAYATLMRDFYVATASRLGITPQEMFARYPLQVRADSAGGANVMEQRSPDVWYHGTTSDVQQFSRVEGGNMWGAGYYLTDNPDTASGYATGTVGNRIAPTGNAGPNVMPVRVAKGDLFDMAAPLDAKTLKRVEKALGQKLKEYTYAGMKNRDLRQVLFEQFTDQNGANEVLRNAGYKGLVEASPTAGPGRTLMVFDAKDITSDITGGVMGQAPNPLQRMMQSITQALGMQPEQPAAQPVESVGPALDMGQFFNQPAYHGSPYKFDKFTLDHIGKGEGAQAYGWGLYFAGNREVAEYYKDTLAADGFLVGNTGEVFNPSTLQHLNVKTLAARGELDAAITKARDIANSGSPVANLAESDLAALEGIKARGGLTPNTGQLYQVEIPEDGEYLLWDKPLSEQPEKVRAALAADMEKISPLVRGSATGEKLYGWLTQGNGGQEAASKYLHSLGIQGIKYLDGTSRASGEGSYNYVVFDENAIKILDTFYQPNQTGNRGEIAFGRDITQTPSVITLFNNADLSTSLHEMGHFQLEVLAHIASQPNAPAEIVQDMEAVLKWFGIGQEVTEQGAVALSQDDRRNGADLADMARRFGMTPRELVESWKTKAPRPNTEQGVLWAKLDGIPELALYAAEHPGEEVTLNYDGSRAIVGGRAAARREGQTPLEVWRAMSLEEKRPYHEQFARGFESYLFEGKAPSIELGSLFARFRSWLVNVYKSIKALNVEINDELRGVFDRMVATDEAIKQAEAARNYGGLFKSPEEMGATPEEWAEYQSTAAEATQSAVEDLQKRSLRDMRWLTNARGRILKEMQRDASAKRKAVEEEVRAEVRAMPVYAAQRFIRYGELAEAERNNEQRRIATEAGMGSTKLDLAALKEMYGEGTAAPWRYLPTGKAGLAGTDGMAPDLVAELFGFTSGDHLVREILAAAPEAEMIEGMTDQRVLERYGDLADPDTLARATDEAIHNEARARFVATELKAITKATGPVRAMTKAAKDFAATLVARKKVRDIKPNKHAAAETRAAKAAEKAMRAGDTTLAATEKRNQLVQNFATRASYDALTEIEKAVKYLRKFDSEGTRKGLDAEYTDQIDALLERFDLRASVSNKDAAKRASLVAWVESQREQGFEPDIPPDLLSEAMRKPYRELTLEELRGLVDTVKQVEHLGRLKKKLLTSKDEREFAAIVSGIASSIEENAQGERELRTRNTTGAMLKDAGNRFLAMHRKMASVSREMDGFKDGGPMWEHLIRSMNAAGDRETSLRADATAKLYKLVKPLLASGKMGGKGVYFDTIGMSLNREERIAIALNMGNAGNMQRLMDGEGWTMSHLQPVLDTITPEEADFVQAVWDFFESYRPEIAAKERRIYGKEPEWVEPQPLTLGGKQLKGGYYPIKYDPTRSGRAEQHAEAEAAKAQMRGAYTSATTRRSFAKSRAQEVTGRPLMYSFAGIYQGANEVLHDLAWHEWLIDANRLVRALDGPIRLHYGPETITIFKKAIEDIAAGDVPAQNVFEKGINHLRMGATVAGLGWNLTTSLLQPFGLTQSMVRVGPGWVGKGLTQWLKAPIETGNEVQAKSAFMRDRARTMQREINEIQNQVRDAKFDTVRGTFFLFIQKMQTIADMPTWLGAYEKAVAEGNAEDRAVALADQAVIDAQGGGQIKDLAQIQRGGPLLKLWTNFYSFFNVAYNLGVEKTKQKITQPKMYPSLAMDYLLLFVVPSVMVSIMKAALEGETDDEDELTKRIAGDQISYLMGTMVGLREVSAAAQKLAGVEQFKSSYGGPAGLRLFQEIDKLATQSAQGEADAAWMKAANNVAGNILHYPSGQINKTVEGAAALIEGKTENPAALMIGAPKN